MFDNPRDKIHHHQLCHMKVCSSVSGVEKDGIKATKNKEMFHALMNQNIPIQELQWPNQRNSTPGLSLLDDSFHQPSGLYAIVTTAHT